MPINKAVLAAFKAATRLRPDIREFYKTQRLAADLLALLRDDNSHFYVCGLKGMEEGVVMALRDIAQEAGLSWETLGATLQREGRLHLETY